MRLQPLLNSRWFAIPVPALVGLGMVALSVWVLRDYGWSLFLGLPFVVGFLAAFCFSFRREVRVRAAFVVTLWGLLALGAAIMVFAIDGLLCLLMALPLTLAIAALGTFLGSYIGMSVGLADRTKTGAGLPVLLILLLPGSAALEHATKPPSESRTVTTRVTVAAPAARVWPVVIAFPRITEPLGDLFRLGIAYPIEARIEGTGVGAIRYCVFSTGSFVEPITAWEEPTRLAFDVTAQPEPMRELSIYEHLDTPHLHGFMVSERGQFRLIEEAGQTVLEGTTWYHHDLAPDWYWGPISDHIIHRIHRRVLDHIRRTVEAPRP